MPRTRYATESPDYMAIFKLRLMSKAKINKSTGCLEWTRAVDSKGYGKISFYGSLWMAHRASWIVNKGEIPKGLWVLHHCDNPPCINPDHLWLGNVRDNALDASRKGRLSHPSHNRAFTAKQVVLITNLRRSGKCRKDIAKQFGVHPSTITALLSRRFYKEVPKS